MDPTVLHQEDRSLFGLGGNNHDGEDKDGDEDDEDDDLRFPWLASLGQKSGPGNWTHVCVGTIVGRNSILSSASCAGNVTQCVIYLSANFRFL